jgi:hypothetical protein
MPANGAKWLDAAVDTAKAAQLGEFRTTLRHSPRYVILSVFLAVIGWLLTVGIIWAIQSGTAPGWAYLVLIALAAFAVGCSFGIRSTAREARARVYLFDDGFVHTDKHGQNSTFAWRDIARVHRADVLSPYTGRQVRRGYQLVSRSGQRFYADALWPAPLLVAIETALGDGRLTNRGQEPR